MRSAGQMPNVRNPAALARTLQWLKHREVRRPRGRPPIHKFGADRSVNELHRQILEIAFRFAGEKSASTGRRGCLRALRYFRSEWRRRQQPQVGRPKTNRFQLDMLIVIHRKPGEMNARAIARRMIDAGAVAMELRKLEELVADSIGTRPKAEPTARKMAKKRRIKKGTTRQTVARKS